MPRLFLFLALMACTQLSHARQPFRQVLADNWQFSQSGLNEWMEATVPGTVHTDLMRLKKIPDPFFGIEERSVQWIDKVGWSYRTTFDADPAGSRMKNAVLVFEGLDTYATVFLNGKEILRADNMFLSWRVDISDILKEISNDLLVVFQSPVIEGLKKQSEYGLRLPAINDQSEAGQIGNNQVSIFTRKAGYHYGWDWGPRLVPTGIWRPVYIEYDSGLRISDVFISTVSLSRKYAHLQVCANMIADLPASVNLDIKADGQTWLSVPVELKKGENRVVREFEVKNPKPWYPRGYGDPCLYRVACTVTGQDGFMAGYQLKTGIRTVRLVREPDPDGRGESFCFEVNGLPVFAKGANYIPGDVFVPRLTGEDYRKVVGSASFANMNMLRVWGGGIYENDLFYELCDEAGILVWQDFMFACSMYPGNREFLASVTEEARQNIIRLRNHPCMALWCGNNEIEAAWGQYDEQMGWGWKQLYTPSQREMIWKTYDTLFHYILPGQVAELNPLVPYWHSSPSAGMGKLATNETRSGDNHYWGVWHQKHPFSDYNRYISRFMSEYGFQSFPEPDAVRKYALPGDWDIESAVMSSHQRSGIGNLRIREYMETDYRVPEDFEDFLYVSQLLQAEGITTAIEAHRKNKPYCMGSLYWQLNDCWPVASWSSTDYYRNYKALHYFARKAFGPVVAIITRSGESLEFRIVSDRPERIRGALNIRVYSLDGRLLSEQSKPAVIGPSGNTIVSTQPVGELLNGQPADEAVIAATWIEKGLPVHRSLFYPVRPKNLKLSRAIISKAVEDDGHDWIIRVSADKVVKNLMITYNGRAGIFSDNYFDLLPGDTAIVRLPKSYAGTFQENELKFRSLADTY